MNRGYSFEKVSLSEIFPYDGVVDATYVIHLVGNGRKEKVIEQLTNLMPSRDTYIVNNNGYKRSIKPSFVDSPPKDLIDAFINIFRDAKTKEYNRILILEDDFIFDEKASDPEVINDIKEFLEIHNDKSFGYMLGTVPLITINSHPKHKNIVNSLGAHACIYSQRFINNILDFDQSKLIDWDYDLRFFGEIYMYYIPLCYQIFTTTENQKFWGLTSNNPLHEIHGKTMAFLLNTQIGENYKEGFKKFYDCHIKIEGNFLKGSQLIKFFEPITKIGNCIN